MESPGAIGHRGLNSVPLATVNEVRDTFLVLQHEDEMFSHCQDSQISLHDINLHGLNLRHIFVRGDKFVIQYTSDGISARFFCPHQVSNEEDGSFDLIQMMVDFCGRRNIRGSLRSRLFDRLLSQLELDTAEEEASSDQDRKATNVESDQPADIDVKPAFSDLEEPLSLFQKDKRSTTPDLENVLSVFADSSLTDFWNDVCYETILDSDEETYPENTAVDVALKTVKKEDGAVGGEQEAVLTSEHFEAKPMADDDLSSTDIQLDHEGCPSEHSEVYALIEQRSRTTLSSWDEPPPPEHKILHQPKLEPPYMEEGQLKSENEGLSVEEPHRTDRETRSALSRPPSSPQIRQGVTELTFTAFTSVKIERTEEHGTSAIEHSENPSAIRSTENRSIRVKADLFEPVGLMSKKSRGSSETDLWEQLLERAGVNSAISTEVQDNREEEYAGDRIGCDTVQGCGIGDGQIESQKPLGSTTLGNQYVGDAFSEPYGIEVPAMAHNPRRILSDTNEALTKTSLGRSLKRHGAINMVRENPKRKQVDSRVRLPKLRKPERHNLSVALAESSGSSEAAKPCEGVNDLGSKADATTESELEKTVRGSAVQPDEIGYQVCDTHCVETLQSNSSNRKEDDMPSSGSGDESEGSDLYVSSQEILSNCARLATHSTMKTVSPSHGFGSDPTIAPGIEKTDVVAELGKYSKVSESMGQHQRLRRKSRDWIQLSQHLERDEMSLVHQASMEVCADNLMPDASDEEANSVRSRIVASMPSESTERGRKPVDFPTGSLPCSPLFQSTTVGKSVGIVQPWRPDRAAVNSNEPTTNVSGAVCSVAIEDAQPISGIAGYDQGGTMQDKTEATGNGSPMVVPENRVQKVRRKEMIKRGICQPSLISVNIGASRAENVDTTETYNTCGLVGDTGTENRWYQSTMINHEDRNSRPADTGSQGIGCERKNMSRRAKKNQAKQRCKQVSDGKLLPTQLLEIRQVNTSVSSEASIGKETNTSEADCSSASIIASCLPSRSLCIPDGYGPPELKNQGTSAVQKVPAFESPPDPISRMAYCSQGRTTQDTTEGTCNGILGESRETSEHCRRLNSSLGNGFYEPLLVSANFEANTATIVDTCGTNNTPDWARRTCTENRWRQQSGFYEPSLVSTHFEASTAINMGTCGANNTRDLAGRTCSENGWRQQSGFYEPSLVSTHFEASTATNVDTCGTNNNLNWAGHICTENEWPILPNHQDQISRPAGTGSQGIGCEAKKMSKRAIKNRKKRICIQARDRNLLLTDLLEFRLVNSSIGHSTGKKAETSEVDEGYHRLKNSHCTDAGESQLFRKFEVILSENSLSEIQSISLFKHVMESVNFDRWLVDLKKKIDPYTSTSSCMCSNQWTDVNFVPPAIPYFKCASVMFERIHTKLLEDFGRRCIRLNNGLYVSIAESELSAKLGLGSDDLNTQLCLDVGHCLEPGCKGFFVSNISVPDVQLRTVTDFHPSFLTIFISTIEGVILDFSDSCWRIGLKLSNENFVIEWQSKAKCIPKRLGLVVYCKVRQYLVGGEVCYADIVHAWRTKLGLLENPPAFDSFTAKEHARSRDQFFQKVEKLGLQTVKLGMNRLEESYRFLDIVEGRKGRIGQAVPTMQGYTQKTELTVSIQKTATIIELFANVSSLTNVEDKQSGFRPAISQSIANGIDVSTSSSTNANHVENELMDVSPVEQVLVTKVNESSADTPSIAALDNTDRDAARSAAFNCILVADIPEPCKFTYHKDKDLYSVDIPAFGKMHVHRADTDLHPQFYCYAECPEPVNVCAAMLQMCYYRYAGRDRYLLCQKAEHLGSYLTVQLVSAIGLVCAVSDGKCTLTQNRYSNLSHPPVDLPVNIDVPYDGVLVPSMGAVFRYRCLVQYTQETLVKVQLLGNGLLGAWTDVKDHLFTMAYYDRTIADYDLPGCSSETRFVWKSEGTVVLSPEFSLCMRLNKSSRKSTTRPRRSLKTKQSIGVHSSAAKRQLEAKSFSCMDSSSQGMAKRPRQVPPVAYQPTAALPAAGNPWGLPLTFNPAIPPPTFQRAWMPAPPYS